MDADERGVTTGGRAERSSRVAAAARAATDGARRSPKSGDGSDAIKKRGSPAGGSGGSGGGGGGATTTLDKGKSKALSLVKSPVKARTETTLRVGSGREITVVGDDREIRMKGAEGGPLVLQKDFDLHTKPSNHEQVLKPLGHLPVEPYGSVKPETFARSSPDGPEATEVRWPVCSSKYAQCFVCSHNSRNQSLSLSLSLSVSVVCVYECSWTCTTSLGRIFPDSFCATLVL